MRNLFPTLVTVVFMCGIAGLVHLNNTASDPRTSSRTTCESRGVVIKRYTDVRHTGAEATAETTVTANGEQLYVLTRSYRCIDTADSSNDVCASYALNEVAEEVNANHPWQRPGAAPYHVHGCMVAAAIQERQHFRQRGILRGAATRTL